MTLPTSPKNDVIDDVFFQRGLKLSRFLLKRRHFFQVVFSVARAEKNEQVLSRVMKQRERTTGRLCWCSVGGSMLLWSSQEDDQSEASAGGGGRRGGGGAEADEKKKHFKYCVIKMLRTNQVY